MKFALDTSVRINSPSWSGRGKIKGISTEMPISGCIYIVEVVESTIQLPNETYPYTNIVMPEGYLTPMERVP